MRTKRLSLSDRTVIKRSLQCMARRLSAYSFVQLIVWKKLYRVEWMRCGGAVCIFYKDALGSFMNCEPLGRDISAAVVETAFAAMDLCNANAAYSRIENVEADRVPFYRSLGYEAVLKGSEYLYERTALAQLAGDRYKSKRASCNYFSKTYPAAYVPYVPGYRRACLALYDRWAARRAATSNDRVYTGMLGDSRTSLETVLCKPSSLGVTGRVILVEGCVRAFTFGYELNPDTFCILFEIADLDYKGISQYIFRQFCVELRRYRYINTMDDSGIARLESVKRSYRPAAMIPSYIVQRPHA